MKATELRIGNLVYVYGIDYIQSNPVVDYSEFEVKQVNSGTLKEIEDFNYTTEFNFHGPIPLTEEWLLKFGFEKVGFRWRLKMMYHWIETDKTSVYINNKQCVLIDYVHQIQNIFYALTGQELTIKE